MIHESQRLNDASSMDTFHEENVCVINQPTDQLTDQPTDVDVRSYLQRCDDASINEGKR